MSDFKAEDIDVCQHGLDWCPGCHAEFKRQRDELNATIAYLQGSWVPERVQTLIAEKDAALERVKELEGSCERTR